MSGFEKILAELGLEFTTEQFMPSLLKMGQGMVAIFVIIGVIIGATMLTNKLFSGKKNK